MNVEHSSGLGTGYLNILTAVQVSLFSASSVSIKRFPADSSWTTLGFQITTKLSGTKIYTLRLLFLAATNANDFEKIANIK